MRFSFGGRQPQNKLMRLGTINNYLVESILQVRYKQGWGFLVNWQPYGTADSTWEPVKTFVLDGGHVNEVFGRFCMEHQPRYNSALKKCGDLSQRSQEQKDNKKIQEEEAEDLPPPEVDTGDRHQELDSREHAARVTGVTPRKIAR